MFLKTLLEIIISNRAKTKSVLIYYSENYVKERSSTILVMVKIVLR